jgi:hypothetical protein
MYSFAIKGKKHAVHAITVYGWKGKKIIVLLRLAISEFGTERQNIALLFALRLFDRNAKGPPMFGRPAFRPPPRRRFFYRQGERKCQGTSLSLLFSLSARYWSPQTASMPGLFPALESSAIC